MGDEALTHPRLVAMLAAAYPTPGWEKEHIRLWNMQMADLDLHTLSVAIQTWIRNKSQRPAIADIRRLVVELRAAAMGQSFPTPGEAWEQVTRAFTRVGSYREPDKELHPLVLQCVNALGWRQLCLSEDQMADRAHFLRLYGAQLERAMCESAVSQGAVPHLTARDEPRRLEELS